MSIFDNAKRFVGPECAQDKSQDREHTIIKQLPEDFRITCFEPYDRM